MTNGSMKIISMMISGNKVWCDRPTDRKFPVLIPATRISENAFQCLVWNMSKAVVCCRAAGKRRTYKETYQKCVSPVLKCTKKRRTLKYIPPVDAAGRVIKIIKTKNLPSILFRAPSSPHSRSSASAFHCPTSPLTFLITSQATYDSFSPALLQQRFGTKLLINNSSITL
jgi:hypothetical protein